VHTVCHSWQNGVTQRNNSGRTMMDVHVAIITGQTNPDARSIYWFFLSCAETKCDMRRDRFEGVFRFRTQTEE
jgi:hypothetical protein